MVVRTSHGEELAVELNGQPLASARVGPRWTAHRVAVAPEQLRMGVNQLSVRWPLPSDTSGAVLAVADTWEIGRPAYVRPVFGEFACLRALFGREPGAADAQPA